MTTPASTIPRKIRSELFETIEDIGQAAALLRESIADADADNLPGSQMCASDALEILSTLESKFSELSAALCTWANARAMTPATESDHGR
jgi:hypothetical protein